MILRRLGNKSKIAEDIIKYFPEHKLYIEPFFGAGGMFLNKIKAKYNILNDIDSDVFNLFQVVMNQKEELIEAFKLMPIHSDLWAYWKKNKETEPIKKALRFLLLSNYGYMGETGTLIIGFGNTSKILLLNIQKTADLFFECRFTNYDFRELFKKIAFRDQSQKDSTFIYCDPPYLGTSNNYSDGFTEKDSMDLFDVLQGTGCKWSMSEFDNPFILNQAKERNLNIINIGERKNMKNRRIEILITNYSTQKTLFD